VTKFFCRITVVGALCVAAIVAGCGGGGGSGGSNIREPLRTVVQDIEPSGTRLDYRDRNYFPFNDGDTWTFDRVQDGRTFPADAVRTVVTGNGTDAQIRLTVDGVSTTTQFRRTSDGVLIIDPLGYIAPPAARALIGDMLAFPEPFYPVGSTRTRIRQGAWDEDVDGDGIFESFHLEIDDVLVGFESLVLPQGTAETARFRTRLVLTLTPSNPEYPVVSASTTEENWLAPGIGIVRSQFESTNWDGSVDQPRQTLEIASGTVAGAELFIEGTLRKLSLPHNALVFDRSRGVYYASVPGSAPGIGNSIATIDALTGDINHSPSVGSEPSALAISGDGSALYVGLNGSGEVAKLQLPAMRESYRTRLPASPFYGQLLAENLAASPVEPDVVAVVLLRPNMSTRHGGVALLRAGAVQPTMTQEHTGSNQIVFDPNGQTVYGNNNNSTEFGLRRLAVRNDGLIEEAMVETNGGFGTRNLLNWSEQGLVLGDAVYGTSDLMLLGRVTALGRGCVPLSVSNRLACFDDDGALNTPLRLVVADASRFTSLAHPTYAKSRGNGSPHSGMVAGPAGQVAIRVGNYYRFDPANEVWLFSNPALN